MSKLWLPKGAIPHNGTVRFSGGSVLRLPTGFGTEVAEAPEPETTSHPHRASKADKRRRKTVRASRRANRGAYRG